MQKDIVKISPLGLRLADLAMDAVRTQRRLDAAFEDNLCFHRDHLAESPLAECLMPLQQRITHWNVSLEAQVTRRRKHNFALGVYPLNLGWQHHYGETQISRARLEMEVRATPVTVEARNQGD